MFFYSLEIPFIVYYLAIAIAILIFIFIIIKIQKRFKEDAPADLFVQPAGEHPYS